MSKSSPAIVFLAVLVVTLAAPLPAARAETRVGQHSNVKAGVKIGDGKHHWLLPNHPRLRRITKAAGFGVITGGLAAPLLGSSVATGALSGAAENGAIRGLKDRHDLKKHKKLDTHIF